MLPSSTPVGTYNVTVTYSGRPSAAVSANVVARNFGFATQTANGQGPAQATYGGYDLNRFTTGTLGQWSIRPANPGDTEWCCGERASDPIRLRISMAAAPAIRPPRERCKCSWEESP